MKNLTKKELFSFRLFNEIWFFLGTGKAETIDTPLSEVTSFQLEFRELSRISNNSIYEEVSSLVVGVIKCKRELNFQAAEKLNRKIHSMEKVDGLVYTQLTRLGQFFTTELAVGMKSDSYYEYLLKQWIQTGMKKDDL